MNDLDMRVLVWRYGQSLTEKPELVILAGSGPIHELDRLNNQERAKFYIEPGDLVRVIVSGAGPFAFDKDQAFALLRIGSPWYTWQETLWLPRTVRLT